MLKINIVNQIKSYLFIHPEDSKDFLNAILIVIETDKEKNENVNMLFKIIQDYEYGKN